MIKKIKKKLKNKVTELDVLGNKDLEESFISLFSHYLSKENLAIVLGYFMRVENRIIDGHNNIEKRRWSKNKMYFKRREENEWILDRNNLWTTQDLCDFLKKHMSYIDEKEKKSMERILISHILRHIPILENGIKIKHNDLESRFYFRVKIFNINWVGYHN